MIAVLAGICGCGGPPNDRSDPIQQNTGPGPGGTGSTFVPPEPVPIVCADAMNDEEVESLSAAFESKFRIGVAVSPFTFDNADGVELIDQHFNHLSPENLLKWSSVHPEPGVYFFDHADRYVDFGEDLEMTIYGHVLVWHQQVPEWVFLDGAEEQVSAEELLSRLREHITMVAGRYGGRIQYWDVVNEAFNDNGSLRDTPWRRILGDDYIAQVFQLADELLPDSKLVYNDYSLASASKRAGAVAMVRDLKNRGIRVDAIGEQGHYNMNYPDVSQLDQMFKDFSELDVEVLITELDVDALPNAQSIEGADLNETEEYDEKYNPWRMCLPDYQDAALAQRWQDIFNVFVDYAEDIEAITFWGVSDGQSWLNNWPVRGRTNYPLLFNRDLTAKSALERVLDTARAE